MQAIVGSARTAGDWFQGPCDCHGVPLFLHCWHRNTAGSESDGGGPTRLVPPPPTLHRPVRPGSAPLGPADSDAGPSAKPRHAGSTAPMLCRRLGLKRGATAEQTTGASRARRGEPRLEGVIVRDRVQSVPADPPGRRTGLTQTVKDQTFDTEMHFQIESMALAMGPLKTF